MTKVESTDRDCNRRCGCHKHYVGVFAHLKANGLEIHKETYLIVKRPLVERHWRAFEFRFRKTAAVTRNNMGQHDPYVGYYSVQGTGYDNVPATWSSAGPAM